MHLIRVLTLCSLPAALAAAGLRSFRPQHLMLLALDPHRLLLMSRNRLASAELPALPQSTDDLLEDSGSTDAEIVIESKPVLVAPEAINILCCHLIAHHRVGIVNFINSVACSSFTVDAINQAAGHTLVVTGMAFNITGPVQPDHFRCSDFKLSRAKVKGAEVLQVEFAVEYPNRLSLAVDVQTMESPAYRVISPLAKPVQAVVWGRTEGATRVRLTLQADDSYILRPAHVVVTDASALRIRLEDYDIKSAYFGGTVPSAFRLIPGRLPLGRLEVVANNALKYALMGQGARGWDVCGGVVRTGQGRSTLPAPR